MRRFSGDVVAPLRRNLERVLRKRGVSPAELDRAARLTSGHTGYFLSGKIGIPDAVTLCLWARALEVSVDELASPAEIAALYDAEIAAPLSRVRPLKRRSG